MTNYEIPLYDGKPVEELSLRELQHIATTFKTLIARIDSCSGSARMSYQSQLANMMAKWGGVIIGAAYSKFTTTTPEDLYKAALQNKENLTPARYQILSLIHTERKNQDREWGGVDNDRENTSHDWIAYITKQLGKCVMRPFDVNAFQFTMLRVAALAVAAIEWADEYRLAKALAGGVEPTTNEQP